MKEYTIYFKIYGKKLKVTTIAANKQTAIQKVKNELTILKVNESEVSNPIADFLNGFKC